MTKWILSEHSKSQSLSVGKEADIGFIVDVTCRIFIFDVPRSKMEYLNYAVLEMLKDSMISSPKYQSTVKILNVVPYVSVFCNELPDMTELSLDRYRVIDIP